MKILLNYFYQLPLRSIVQCFLMLSLLFICIRHRFGHCRWLRRGIWITLCIWFSGTLWITMLSRTPGTAYSPELIPFHSYRKLLATGNAEIFRTNFMNVALFYPAGLLSASLLPEEWLRGRKLTSVVIVFALFSCVVECAQFCFSLGEPEVDDLIHNTLGAAIGTLPILFQDSLLKPPRS